MTTPNEGAISPGPYELREAARSKYLLAITRVRRGPVELALLSLHGCLEDGLRAYAMQLRMPEQIEPLPQLVEALTRHPQSDLKPEEAKIIIRFHRLRTRVSQGEQINVKDQTIGAYQQLVGQLLNRHGVPVVELDPFPSAMAGEVASQLAGANDPRESAHVLPVEGAGLREATGPRVTPDATKAEPVRPQSDASPAGARRTRPRTETGLSRIYPEDPAGQRERRRTETGLPRRERTVYPDGSAAQYHGGGRSRVADERSMRLDGRERSTGARQALEQAERTATAIGQIQGWLVPLLVVATVVLVGVLIFAGMQQNNIASDSAEPLASASFTTEAVTMTSAADDSSGNAAGDPAGVAVAPPPEPTAVAPVASAGLSVGRIAFVSTTAEGGLALRAEPGTSETIDVLAYLAPGTAVEVVEGPIDADGFSWWQVRVGNDRGWCAGEFLSVRE
jgi:hypothetical protein